MKIVALIPARGGSQEVKRKNIRLFNGKPLIDKTISSARTSVLLSDIYVSTDDSEIAGYAQYKGLQTVGRPAKLAKGETPVWKTLEWFASQCDDGVDLFVEIHPTYPLRPVGLIDKVIAYALESEKDGIIVASPMFDKIWRKREGGYERLAQDIQPNQREFQEHLWRTHYGLCNVFRPNVALSGNPWDCNLDFFPFEESEATIDLQSQAHFDLTELIDGAR